MQVYLQRALAFLVEFLFGVYILLFMLRFILERTRAVFHGPPAMLLEAITAPPVRILRPLLPRPHNLDLCVPLILLILQATQLILLHLIVGAQMTPIGIAALTCTELLETVINLYLFSIIIMAVLSWLTNLAHSPLGMLLLAVNTPLLSRLHRWIPPMHGMDLAPMAAILLLWLARILVHAPLHDLSIKLMFAG